MCSGNQETLEEHSWEQSERKKETVTGKLCRSQKRKWIGWDLILNYKNFLDGIFFKSPGSEK